MLQQCSHPNVVRYLGSYQGEEYLWVSSHDCFSCLTSKHLSGDILCGCFKVWDSYCLLSLQIVMEYCGGGSVADLMNVTEEPLEEYQIAYICREALKVRSVP